MKWQKLGLIYDAKAHVNDWAKHSALGPTPLFMEDKIRVYFAARDDEGISRIRYADVNPADPTELLAVSAHPVLDIGAPGTFDDNGVILGDIVATPEGLLMYYVGFQLVKKAKFFAFTGAALSHDQGETFTRVQQFPVLDRTNEGLFIRAVHRVLYEEGVYKIWYSVGSRWQMIDGKPYPSYYIKYLESDDPLKWPNEGKTCVPLIGQEYRIGRPRVYHLRDKYQLFCTKGELDQSYLPALLESKDGKNWPSTRQAVGLMPSASGFDSTTLCYPSLLTVNNKTYAFYNGNDMGKDGFGCAVLSDENQEIYQ